MELKPIFILRYRKVDYRWHYYEQPHMIEQRHSYLHRLRANRTDKRPVVNVSETWANAHDERFVVGWQRIQSLVELDLGGVRYSSI